MKFENFREELRKAIRLENLDEIFKKETERMMDELVKIFREDLQYKLPLPEGEQLLFYLDSGTILKKSIEDENLPKDIIYPGPYVMEYPEYYCLGIAFSKIDTRLYCYFKKYLDSKSDIEIGEFLDCNYVVNKFIDFENDVFKFRRANYSSSYDEKPFKVESPQAYRKKWILDYLPPIFSELGFKEKFVGVTRDHIPAIVFSVPQEFVTE